MADEDILNVFLKISNPDVFDRLERLKNANYSVNIKGSIDKGITDILGIKEHKIVITADTKGILNNLKDLERTIESTTKLRTLKVDLSGNAMENIAKIKKAMMEIQAIDLAPQLNKLGYLQNNNPKTYRGGDLGIVEASGLKYVEVAQRKLDEAKNITAEQQKMSREFQKSTGFATATANEFTSPRNEGRFPSTQTASYGDDLQLSAKQAAARRLEAKYKAEDAAVQAQKDFERAIELANAQTREEAIVNFKKNTQGVPSGPFSNINDGKKQEAARQAAIEDFRKNVEFQGPASDIAARNKAIEDYRQASSSVGSKAQGKFSAIDAPQQRTELLKEIGQSTLLGALQGQGALPLAGSALGSIAGSGFGLTAFGGALGGAAGAAVDTALHAFVDVLHKAVEAGLSFNTSILGISSVLQATNNVTTPSGQGVGLQGQLAFQQTQARSIQKLARQKLLPLGISGEKESTLVQSIISGAAQRGIQLNPEQAATLAERLGGTIQSQRPELLANSGQLRRDVEDLFSGSPNNTVLKTLIKGYAPSLGKATSGEDLIRRSEGLASFPETLKNSSTNPVVAAQKFNAARDQVFTSFGDALDNALIPGINLLTKSLSNPSLLVAVESVGQSFGTLGSVMIGFSTIFTDVIANFARSGQTLSALATLALPDFGGPNAKLAKLKAQKDAGFFTDENDINKRIKEAEEAADRANNGGLRSTPKASVSIKALLEQAGIASLSEASSPDLKSGSAILAALAAVKEKLPAESQERIEDARAKSKTGKLTDDQIKGFKSEDLSNLLGLSIERGQALQKASPELTGLFDTSSALGQINKLQASSVIASQISEEANNTLLLARQKQSELDPNAKVEDINKANQSVIAATEGLIKARNNERAAILELNEAELNRSKALRDSQFDAGTLQGRSGLIGSGLQDANDRIANASGNISQLRGLLEGNTSPIDRSNIESQIEAATLEFNKGQTGRAQLSREAQTNAIDLAQGPVEAQKALADFARATVAAKDRFDALGEQLVKSQEALADFDRSRQLRSLGREGILIDNAEKALKATQGDAAGTFSVENEIPTELYGLVKGTFGFSEQNRQRFESRKALEDLRNVDAQNTPERFQAREDRSKADLQRGVRRAESDLAAAPGEELIRKFQGLRQVVALKQQGVSIGAEGEKFIATQAKDLGVDLPKLETAETINANVPSNVSSINESVKAILGILSGKSAPENKKTTSGVLDPATGEPVGAKEGILNKIGKGISSGQGLLDTAGQLIFGNPFGDEEPLKKITTGILENPLDSDSAIAGLKKTQSAITSANIKGVRRRQPGDLLNDTVLDATGSANTKSKAIFEDVVGGFLDADIKGIKEKNNNPTSGLKNPLFEGGLFGASKDSVESDKGSMESTINSAVEKIVQGVGTAFRNSINGI